MDRREVALDHNIPLPLLTVLADYIPEVRLVPIRQIDQSLTEFEDHDLIYELARRDYAVMVTANYKMLEDPQVLVALHQTKFTLMAIEHAGDDALLATGALLRDLLPMLRKLNAKGQVFRSRPLAPTSVSPYRLLQGIATRHDRQVDDLLDELKVSNWRQRTLPQQ